MNNIKYVLKSSIKFLLKPIVRLIKWLLKPFLVRLKHYVRVNFFYDYQIMCMENLKLLEGYQIAYKESLRLLKDCQIAHKEDLRQLKEIIKQTIFLNKISMKPITVAESYKLFTQIEFDRRSWETCDLIITCSALLYGAKLFFPEKQIICLDEPDQLYALLKDQRVNSIGILSPSLSYKLFKSQECIYCLIKSCQQSLIYTLGYHTEDESDQHRHLMHQVGFYEVALVNGDAFDDNISIGCLTDGRYLLIGSQPGMQLNKKNWLTYKASRLPATDIRRTHLWKNVFTNPFKFTHNGFSPRAQALSLAYITLPALSCDINIEIHAEMFCLSGSGNASLIACYDGPEDLNMYQCKLEIEQQNKANISLWKNNNKWVQLNSIEIPSDRVTVRGAGCQISLWFRVNNFQLTIGTSELVLIDLEDRELKRTPTLGIRAVDETISINNIVCLNN